VSIEALLASFIGVAGLLLSIYLYRVSRRYKRIGYAVIAQTPLVAEGNHVSESLEVRFDGEIVTKVRLLTVAIANQGTQGILPDDFVEGPLRLRPTSRQGVEPRLLAADLRGPRPPDLRPTLSIKDNVVLIEPLLLNRGDRFGVQLLADGGESDIELEGRLADVTKRPLKTPRAQTLISLVGGGGVGLSASSVWGLTPGTVEFVLVIAVGVLSAGLLGLSAAMARRRIAFTRGLLEDAPSPPSQMSR